ncbi:hypothetical protein V6R21_26700 [Limibacter armeniacum]|uniref:HD domain-containing protein n=1 Tax=Limibacter armeniacum TaxID=466084 RepID=UPI002FE69470
MRNKWNDLAGKYSQNHILITKLYNELIRKYNETKRHYHNLSHIQGMLYNVEKFQDMAEDYDALQFAVWYHDAIMATLRSDNEAQSAIMAKDALLQLGIAPERIQKVINLICRTANHLEQKESDTVDTAIMLDADLVILGSEPDRYRQYADQIRQEYQVIPFFIFKEKRKQMLHKFLEVPFIYRLPDVREKLEEQARWNIENELKRLGA